MKSTFSKFALAVFSLGLLWSCDVEEFDPSVSVESVTLNKPTLELVVGQRDSLVATVLPENASDKSVVWTSSADSVVTVSDGLLEALSIGNATITVTTEDGEKTAQCAVTVLSAAQSGSLSGLFSVADGRRIRFAEGNLRFALADSTWGFYSEQYLCGPAVYTAGHNAEISLFTWGYGAWSVSPDTKSHSTAYAEDGASLANSDDWGAALAGTGSWRTLTSVEWNHILKVREGAADKCKYGVSVCGQPNCLVIAPDSFTGTIEESYTQQTWAAAEQNDGLVCLPAAGVRNGDVTTGVGENGHYWTASSAGEGKALSIETKSAPATTSLEAKKLDVKTGRRDLAPVSSEVRPTNISVNVEQPRNYVADLNKALKKSNSFKRGTQPAIVSNGSQQGEQKENKILVSKQLKANHNAAPKTSPAKAAVNDIRPTGADSTVTAVAWSYDNYYYDVYLASENTTYIFELLESTGGLTYGTTYTYADMYADWVCTLDEEGLPLVKATDATLTVTKDQDGLIHIAATMVLNGVKHVISYNEAPFEPSGVQIPLNGTDLTGKYNSYYNFYMYTGKVGNNTVQLVFNATAEQATYTKDLVLTDYCVYYSPDYSTYVEFVKAASDFTVTTTEKTKTLAGSIYADNGDEYIINLVYQIPDAKEINIKMKDATLTNRTAAGYWTIDGQTDDKVNSFKIYFQSKALQGTWTDVKQLYSYETWVSDKSSGSNVYYENLSAVNLTSYVTEDDSLVVEGTLNLADSKGNPAIVNIHASTYFKQTWGEWADFAPFDKNTGKFNYATLGNYTQTGIEVQERKDNTGLKQYKLKSWGKGYYDAVGQDLILNMNPDYTFTFVSNPVNLGEEVILADVATAYNNPAYASYNSYDPETGVFSFYTAVVFASSGQIYTAAEESLVMDKPITQRDTVRFSGRGVAISECVNSQTKVQTGWFYELADASTGYEFLLQSTVVAEKYGTFSYEDKTLGSNYYNVFDPQGGRQQFVEGSITVGEVGDSLVFDGVLVAEDEKAYVLHFSQPAGVLTYDTDDAFDATFAYGDMSTDLDEGVIYISATNAENLTMGLVLFTDPANTEIPAGTYVISDSEEAGTALKSVGVYAGYLTECWAGVKGASGISDCWFLVDGTVNLSYDEYGKLNVEVDATNSWGQPVKAKVTYEFVAADPLLRENGYSVRLVSDVE